MSRALTVFAILFLALPVLGILAALFLPGLATAYGLAIVVLVLLTLGFTVALGFVDVEDARS